MITLFFDIIVLIIACCLVCKPRYGVPLYLMSLILVPYFVRFIVGPVSVAAIDVFNLAIVASFLFDYKKILRDVPKWLRKYAVISMGSAVVLMCLSSAVVPYAYQMKSIVKEELIGVFMVVFLFCKSFRQLKLNFFLNIFFAICLVAGLYGIFAYIIRLNPYVTALSYNYTGTDFLFSFFLDEVRGGLNGRTSGTMVHPLSWGQFWVVLIPTYFLFREKINKCLSLGVILAGVVNVYLSGSRAALIGLVVSLLFLLPTMKLKKIVRIVLVALLSVPLLVSVLDVSVKQVEKNPVVKFVTSTLFFFDESKVSKSYVSGSSADMRKNQFDAVLGMAERNPVAGIGYNYQYYCLENKSVANSALWGLESIVFKKIVEQGFAGLIVFILLILLLYHSIKIRIKENGRKILPFVAFLMGYLVNIVMTGMQGNNYVLFLAISALYYMYLRNGPSYDSQNNPLLLAK